ncbi:hypothetical protein B9Z19DRAFT_1191395 [Tuber borchii]|uniref:Uncharacterized protein n=1 Tax=Tuber borchii TaxID=42251 RepID=A0A2T7A0A5_TUBBO|nr:hypothetical protein B9Z19DRAFT_1191395 [Tuber borchii]
MSGRPHESMPERATSTVISFSEVIGNNTAEEERRSRIAEFELRARNMGITDENLVAQKVAIWEEIWVAEQNGDSVGMRSPVQISNLFPEAA